MMNTRRFGAAGLALALSWGVLGVAASEAQESTEPSPTDHQRTVHDTEHGSMATAGSDADHGIDHGSRSEVASSPATEVYRAANLAMHSAMDIEFSDDADIDFARGMLAHHLGAIDMARIVLEHGEDPDLRQLAEEMVATQEAEVAFLRNWLEEHSESAAQ